MEKKHNQSGRILVVDDEAALAKMTCEILSMHGHHADYFTDSSEAMNVIRERLNDYDMLITDQTMPNYSGADLARLALKINADFPVIITTGYSPHLNKEEALRMGVQAFLSKPVSNSELIAKVNNALKKAASMQH